MSRKVAIVTGASSGIGAAIAVALAKAGCNVVATYGDNQDGGEATATICKSEGVEAITVKVDISSDEDCRAVAQAALDKWGRIDVLVNNAGTTRFADATDLNAINSDDFQRIFAVNVTGCYQMTRAAADHLRNAKGSVVNISSHSGFSGIGSSIAYAASKGALNTLTLSLARSLAPQVRVNAVCPGFVDTDWMAAKLDAEALNNFKDKAAKITPLKRIPTAENIAEAALWFTLGSVPATGQLLVVDSGTHLTVADPL
jgi:3-oxoacyl-[acyl-carrier protein] reductase|tara:strand:+ start:345 stop:1115 length:771 start_codon:yes stop_codon:yes gene_type:complete